MDIIRKGTDEQCNKIIINKTEKEMGVNDYQTSIIAMLATGQSRYAVGLHERESSDDEL